MHIYVFERECVCVCVHRYIEIYMAYKKERDAKKKEKKTHIRAYKDTYDADAAARRSARRYQSAYKNT